MLRGNWSIIAALAGLGALFWAFAFGLSLGALDTDEERYDAYRYATDQPAEIDPATARKADPKSFEYRRPCQQPKGRDESDLCAQWRAANAAENSALWAKWGFWITALGAAGLLITIVQGRLALDRAAEANKIAARVAAADLRPYLFVDRVVLEKEQSFFSSKRDADGEPIEGLLMGSVVVYLRNFGRVPARRIRVFMKQYYVSESGGRLSRFKMAKVALPICAPGHERQVFGTLAVPTEDRLSFDLGLITYVIRLSYSFEDDGGATYSERASYTLIGNEKTRFYLLTENNFARWRAARRNEEPELEYSEDGSAIMF